MDAEGGHGPAGNRAAAQDHAVGAGGAHHRAGVRRLGPHRQAVPREVIAPPRRWFNQLNPELVTETLTKEEEALLFAEQSRLGNKWAKICGSFPNRSDNFIKNHFYSTFRKAYRKVNRELLVLKGREIKLIKNVVVNRVLLCAEEKFEEGSDTDPRVIALAIDIKNRLLPFAGVKRVDKDQEQDLLTLVELIGVFKNSEGYVAKKRAAKKRRSVYMTASGQDEEVVERRLTRKRANEKSSESESDSCFVARIDSRQQIGSENNVVLNTFANVPQPPQPQNLPLPTLPVLPGLQNPSFEQTQSTPEIFRNEHQPPKLSLQSIFLGYVPIFLNPESCTHFFPNGTGTSLLIQLSNRTSCTDSSPATS